MKGDFSRWRDGSGLNFNGILPQQGKVLLDSDGIAQTMIENDWRNTAARDFVGDMAGVPSTNPESFAISAASWANDKVVLTVDVGHLWADGRLVRLHGGSGSKVQREATWLQPPLVANAADGTVADGTMDAVVLEVWQQAVSGFQMPNELIEPALGGPDTAERLQTAFAFRLARLNAGETCSSLHYDESGRGTLTASLVPPITVSGDCPTVGSGGYSGFEHQLYRIEVANVNSGDASQFKWSRINGGLVGRGTFNAVDQTIAITANLPAITGVNQSSFYLEIETYSEEFGFTQVTLGAPATLTGATLQCSAAMFGQFPGSTGTVFFRLWDGISPVANFPVQASPVQLENGILLQFEADGAGKYLPGDYWMFPVRAQGVSNPQTLINAAKPQGIVYTRVPLAEITWASSGSGTWKAGTIEDCRAIIQPLTERAGCCTCTVGDGVESFGQFTSIQKAIDSLPKGVGGEVCLLPGRFFENVSIKGRKDIVIHGCGWQTRVASVELAPNFSGTPTAAYDGTAAMQAVFKVSRSEHIKFESFVVEAGTNEAGIAIDGDGALFHPQAVSQQGENEVRIDIPRAGAVDITIGGMFFVASTLPAVIANQVQVLRIEGSRIGAVDVRSVWSSVYVSGTELRIEGNWIGVWNEANLGECPTSVVKDLFAGQGSGAGGGSSSVAVGTHPGGIQVAGWSTDVYLLENEIQGGGGNGITLGSIAVLDANGNNTGGLNGVTFGVGDCCTWTLQQPGTTTSGETIVSGGPLANIHIHRNRLRTLGLCGIGPVGFFNLVETLEVITIDGLTITENAISNTLRKDLASMSAIESLSLGYGAICVPDVMNLIVRDNAITDTGASPRANVCGIFVLHGEMVEISRNQVIETRDWAEADEEAVTVTNAGGIVILYVTPPAFKAVILSMIWDSSGGTSTAATDELANPLYEPGLPALRVEENVVRIAIGYSMFAIGTGPFHFSGNHFSTGGTIQDTGLQVAQAVLIVNMGTPLEFIAPPSSNDTEYQDPLFGARDAFANVSSGATVFTGNICQLEARAGGETELASVLVYTLDHLIFSNNHCWLDSSTGSALADVILVGFTANVTSNRFQEAWGSVLLSGFVFALLNITSLNVSTACLLVLGVQVVNVNNLTVISMAPGLSEICAPFKKLSGY